MASKGILKLNYEDKSRNLNYVKKPDGKIVVITSGRSNKVAYMKEHDLVELNIDDQIVQATPIIIENVDQVKENFDYMTTHENNHFKAFNDVFVSVEFSL